MRGSDGGREILERPQQVGRAGSPTDLKVCDLTQFYSPRSGGVKRYLHEKIAYIQTHSAGDQHLLIVPGERSEVTVAERSRVYAIDSPRVSRQTGYRALLNLRAVEEIIAHEKPDVIESADPYQLGWAAAAIASRHRIPAVAFYHSDFGDAYLRRPAERLGAGTAAALMKAAQRYVRELYNRFELTLAPSADLASRLRDWGVRAVRVVELGVNTNVFTPAPPGGVSARAEHQIPAEAKLLVYVGRLAREKNTATLFKTFELLTKRQPRTFHLLVIGDGQQRQQVQELQATTDAVTWLPYCADAAHLARLYRASDLFVHPGTQETFGLVALESQACGTPVVGIRGSAMDNIILHDQRTWARENTPEALVDAVEQSLTIDLPAMGAIAASAVAERYSWKRVFDNLFCIYREVCANYGRPAAE